MDQASYRKKILKSFKGKPKKFYSYMQKLRTVKDKVAQLTMENGELSSTDQEAAQILGKYFSSVFVKEMEMKTDDNEPEQDRNDNFKIIIDKVMVKDKLLKLQEDKAQGPDDIHPAVLCNCAEAVSKPLSMIYKSLEEGVLPEDWKAATVCPIYKKGDESDPGNYRPVSLTSVPCKVMESIIKDEVTAFLDKNGFYNNCQHGSDLLAWIGNFLHNRKMRVYVRGSCSEWIEVISGVP